MFTKGTIDVLLLSMCVFTVYVFVVTDQDKSAWEAHVFFLSFFPLNVSGLRVHFVVFGLVRLRRVRSGGRSG